MSRKPKPDLGDRANFAAVVVQRRHIHMDACHLHPLTAISDGCEEDIEKPEAEGLLRHLLNARRIARLDPPDRPCNIVRTRILELDVTLYLVASVIHVSPPAFVKNYSITDIVCQEYALGASPRQPLTISQKVKIGGTFWLKSELFLTKIRIANFD